MIILTIAWSCQNKHIRSGGGYLRAAQVDIGVMSDSRRVAGIRSFVESPKPSTLLGLGLLSWHTKIFSAGVALLIM
jgi:hypothetical protein